MPKQPKLKPVHPYDALEWRALGAKSDIINHLCDKCKKPFGPINGSWKDVACVIGTIKVGWFRGDDVVHVMHPECAPKQKVTPNVPKHKKVDKTKVPPSVTCPYCGSKAELVSSTKVYYGRKDYGLIWCCSNYPRCDSYVGTDPQGRPLGRLANAELRGWKIKAHDAFDPLIRAKMQRVNCSHKEAKTKAYKWLSEQLNIPREECHIAMFDTDLCKLVVEICSPYTNRLKGDHT